MGMPDPLAQQVPLACQVLGLQVPLDLLARPDHRVGGLAPRDQQAQPDQPAKWGLLVIQASLAVLDRRAHRETRDQPDRLDQRDQPDPWDLLEPQAQWDQWETLAQRDPPALLACRV